MAGRSSSALSGGSPPGGRSRPVIVKSVSAAHSRTAAVAMASYIARLDGRATRDTMPKVHDHDGLPVASDRVRQVLATWGLTPDRENLSLMARRRQEEGRGVSDLPPHLRYRRVQARHFVLSAPVEAGEIPLFEVAVAATVRDTFTSWGHQSLWALHLEHGKEVHAHVLIRAEREGGGRLRMQRDGAILDGLRETLAENCRAVGLDVEATRRGDRPELLQMGRESADARGVTPYNGEGRLGLAEKIGRVAPDWLVADGVTMLSRIADREKRRRRGLTGDVTVSVSETGDEGGAQVTGPYAPLYRRLRELRVYDDIGGRDGVVDALWAMDRLRREEWSRRAGRVGKRATSTPLAYWLLRRQPVAFGAVTTAARRLRSDPEILAALKSLPPPGPHQPRLAPGTTPAEQVRLSEYLHLAREARDTARRRRELVLLARGLELGFPMNHEAMSRAIRLRDMAFERGAHSSVPLAETAVGLLSPPATTIVRGGGDGPSPRPEAASTGVAKPNQVHGLDLGID